MKERGETRRKEEKNKEKKSRKMPLVPIYLQQLLEPSNASLQPSQIPQCSARHPLQHKPHTDQAVQYYYPAA
ncbi:hypothetical protein I7I53_07328 [Histoplasma capsulatum var. duboisii H88]|uniref:Uncharacterized protein n=1 Tax=Ajellomyces capsulatus (strain H88) TaxID=544711 RepID=A0A8A1LBU4_AJEC8|nr:hypothetical protein I7I53_07328 [Histoplasma capsulatum var. duboisii H88]